jgi:predicted Fe-Mo cluster-binding NifX family protein
LDGRSVEYWRRKQRLKGILMKVAVTAQGQELTSTVDLRFGRAKWILVVDTDTGQHEVHDNTVHLNLPQGAGIQTGQNIADLGVEAVITGNAGPNAFRTLSAAHVRIFLAANQTVGEAVAALKEGRLQEIQQANVEGHLA